MKNLSFIILLLMSVKLLAIDTSLYSADIHTINTTTTVILDHSLEDFSDSTTTCETTFFDIPEAIHFFTNPIMVLTRNIPELSEHIISPPPRA